MPAPAFDSLSTAEKPVHGDLKIMVDKSDFVVIFSAPCRVAKYMCSALSIALMSNALHIAHPRMHPRQLVNSQGARREMSCEFDSHPVNPELLFGWPIA